MLFYDVCGVFVVRGYNCLSSLSAVVVCVSSNTVYWVGSWELGVGSWPFFWNVFPDYRRLVFDILYVKFIICKVLFLNLLVADIYLYETGLKIK